MGSNINTQANIQTDVDLKERNLLGLRSMASHFCVVDSVEVLNEALAFAQSQNLRVIVLGGGSNVIMSRNLHGLVLSMEILGLEQTANTLTVGAGLDWHGFVLHTISKGLSGLENLSLIPGRVGAAPIQNIGAYGVEVAERITRVQGIHIPTNTPISLSNSECEFSYRDSVFKSRLKNEVVITHVTFELDETFNPRLEYAGVAEYLSSNHLPVTSQTVSDAISDIRRAKLPDPMKLGNVGSFFKNSVISADQAATLSIGFPNLPTYPQANGTTKVSSAYLIDQLGLKGLKRGGASVSDQHALVIQNDGEASFEDIKDLAESVIDQVKQRFEISLEIEPLFLT